MMKIGAVSQENYHSTSARFFNLSRNCSAFDFQQLSGHYGKRFFPQNIWSSKNIKISM